MEHSTSLTPIFKQRNLHSGNLMDRAETYLSQSTTAGTPVEYSQQHSDFSQAVCFDIFSGVTPQKGEGKSKESSTMMVVVKPSVMSKAKSMILDFSQKCLQPRAQLMPIGETRQCKITEFFKVEKKTRDSNNHLRMPSAPKCYTSDKISYYFRSLNTL